MANKPILYVLDTNVLMHDPLSLFRFEEHNIFICSTVLEELDHNKKGLDTPQRNARMVLNFIDELIEGVEPIRLAEGVELSAHKQAGNAKGSVFFEDSEDTTRDSSGVFVENTGDNRIIQTVRDLRRSKRFKENTIIVVSQDTGMRIKCKIEGILCERYLTDFVASDADIFYSGIERLPAGYLLENIVDSKNYEGVDHYFLPLDAEKKLLPGTMLISPDGPFKRGFVRTRNNEVGVCVQTVWSYSNGHKAFNIHERNEEQGLALWALMNPDIDLVVLSGPAGTGKTLLTLAAGLEQTIPGGGRETRYDDLMFVCGLNPVGKKDIGFLPGTKEEKLDPWMGAVHDNLDVLFHPVTGVKDCKRQDVVNEYMSIEAVMHTRGRTMHGRFLVIDEGQNYTAHEMRTLITRAGDGTKVVVLGNNAQIDNPYVSVHTNGFSYLISQFRGAENFAHVMLKGGVRSRLAQRANELLQ